MATSLVVQIRAGPARRLVSVVPGFTTRSAWLKFQVSRRCWLVAGVDFRSGGERRRFWIR